MNLAKTAYAKLLESLFRMQNRDYLQDGWKSDVDNFLLGFGQPFNKLSELIRQSHPSRGNYGFSANGEHLPELYIAACLSHLLSGGVGVSHILEIGTGLGRNTNLMAKLAPTATVHTFDLPEDDPYFQVSPLYDPIQRSVLAGSDTMKTVDPEFLSNIGLPNIRTYLRNSLHLFSHFRLDPSLRFDFIWMDGAHHYPAVAWDFAFAYNTLKSGGVLLIDDLSIERKVKNPITGKITKLDHTDVESLLNYVRPRISEKITILPKRPLARKFIALLKKSE